MEKRIYCFDDRTDVCFGTCPADSGPPGLIGQLLGKMNGNHQDGNFRKQRGNLPGDVKAVEIGHLEIQQDHVRRIFSDALDGFSAGPSLITNLPGALLLEEDPKVISNRRVVIDHKNSNQAALPFTFSG